MSYIYKTGSIFILQICSDVSIYGTHGQVIYTAHFFFQAGYKHFYLYVATLYMYYINPLISFIYKRYVCKCDASGCLKLPQIFRSVERKTYVPYLPPLLNHLFTHNIDKSGQHFCRQHCISAVKVKDQSRT